MTSAWIGLLWAAASAVTPPQRLMAVRTLRPPVIDGRLDDDVWSTAPVGDGFTQAVPFDGEAPTERTRLRVIYDDHALYVGFDCEQQNAPVVERLTRRDEDSESEWVTFFLDTLHDGKNAYLFGVNVSGVLLDGQLIDQTTFSIDWDENWEARGAKTERGWSAEMRIPFRILRFDARRDVQTWGMQANRYIAQKQETDLWTYVPRDVADTIAHFGTLEGLSRVDRGGGLEVQPFAIAQMRRRDASADTLAAGYDRLWSAGLDLRMHVTQDLTLDAAINPDFAQVEADQVILNLTNYETFLPEKRRLFLEGAGAFLFPLQVFYSRRIGSAPPLPVLPSDPTFAARAVDTPHGATIYGAVKMAGQVGGNWTLGTFNAVTASNRIAVQGPGGVRISETLAPITSFNVLRLKRSIGRGGHVGMIATGATTFEGQQSYPAVAAPGADPSAPPYALCPTGQIVQAGQRCFHDAYVGGADALWRSASGEIVANGAVVASRSVAGPPLTLLDGTRINPGDGGVGGRIRLAKDGGQNLIWSADYNGAGRRLEYNDVGYMPRQNLHQVQAQVGYRTLKPGSHTLETLSSLVVTQRRSLAGLDLGQTYEINSRARFPNFWTVTLAADASPHRFDDREIGDGAALERAGFAGGRIEVATDPGRSVNASLVAQAHVVGGGGITASIDSRVAVHLLPQLQLELVPLGTWASGEWRYGWSAPSDSEYLFGRLLAKSVSLTLRASYTFSTRLTLQTYVQAFLASGHYTDVRSLPRLAADLAPGTTLSRDTVSTAASSDVSSDFEEAALNANVVLRWEYLPGCTAFLVYSRSQVPAVPNGSFMAPADLELRALGRSRSADVIVFKLSYWWAS